MKSSLRLIPLLILGCLKASAAQMCVLPWDGSIAKRDLAISVGEKTIEVGYLHPDARSQPVSVPSDAKNLRLQFNDRLDEVGKPLSVPLKIPAGTKKPLLLLLPNEKSKAGIMPLVIEDDNGSFKWGTIRIISLGDKPLAFRWDKKAKELKPGWKPVDISPGGNPRNMEVFLYLKEDLSNPLYSAVWEHREDIRQLVFVVPSQDKSMGPYEFKIIPETRLEVESPSPTQPPAPAE